MSSIFGGANAWSSKEQQAKARTDWGLGNAPKTLPKTHPNRPKIPPRPSKIEPKSSPRPSQNPPRALLESIPNTSTQKWSPKIHQEAPRALQILPKRRQGPSKPSPNPLQNATKTHPKRASKNLLLGNTFLVHLDLLWALIFGRFLQTEMHQRLKLRYTHTVPKNLKVFPRFFKVFSFCTSIKNCLKTLPRRCFFQPSILTPFLMDLASILDPKILPKPLKNRSKIERNRQKNAR